MLNLSVNEMEVLLDALKECPTCSAIRRVPGYCPKEQNDLYNKIKEVYKHKIDEVLKELDASKPETEPTHNIVEYGLGII